MSAKRKRKMWPYVLLALVLLALAAALGTMWSLKRLYPYNLKPAIEQAAQPHGLDPLFVAAVIRTESNFRTGARSKVGALGLMQVMPETGQWVAAKNKWTYSDELLLDGAYNMQVGCWYLAFLRDQFDGDWTLTLAAYNAGQGAVRRWRQEGRFSQDPPDIPFAETRNFVKKVLNAYEKYKLLYQDR